MGMLAYYWVLATPAVGFLFGCYLYIAVNWFHVHYDEAFSALRIPNFKGFSRLHINTDGDLEIYGLAMDKVRQARQFLIFWSSMLPKHPSSASHRALIRLKTSPDMSRHLQWSCRGRCCLVLCAACLQSR